MAERITSLDIPARQPGDPVAMEAILLAAAVWLRENHTRDMSLRNKVQDGETPSAFDPDVAAFLEACELAIRREAGL